MGEFGLYGFQVVEYFGFRVEGLADTIMVLATEEGALYLSLPDTLSIVSASSVAWSGVGVRALGSGVSGCGFRFRVWRLA